MIYTVLGIYVYFLYLLYITLMYALPSLKSILSAIPRLAYEETFLRHSRRILTRGIIPLFDCISLATPSVLINTHM